MRIRSWPRFGGAGQTVGSTAALIAGTAANNGAGFLFWWLAARMFTADVVGLAAAAISAMLFLSQISILGLGTTLAGVLHRERDARPLGMVALSACALAGTVLGASFALIIPSFIDEFGALRADAATLTLFAIGVGLTTVGAVLDHLLVAVLRAWTQLLRNVVFAVCRVAFLLAAFGIAGATAMTLYGVWAVATIVSIGASVAVVGPRVPVRGLPWRRLQSLAFEAMSHHALNLSRSSPMWVLPIVVTALVSAEANASFYVALLMANFVALIGSSATFSLYVVGARSPRTLWRQARLTIALSLGAAVAGTIVLSLFGGAVLRLFGSTYTEAGGVTLTLLTAGSIPLAVKDHWIAHLRLQGSVHGGSLVAVALLVVELGAAAVGAVVAGVVGLAAARLGILVLQAVAMMPRVASLARERNPRVPMIEESIEALEVLP